ncbi:MAG: HAD family hydrolase [Gammaproteobacteria bacterium]|nr:HAD family hydrolase [Gammaproteobacteria bacterium]
MMRAWENRPDTVVVDEPFYASYLARTGLEHPGRDLVMASQPRDWRTVVQSLLDEPPGSPAVFYQKHMAHHVFDDMHGPWLDELTHIFLIREPASMIVSLDKVTPDPRIEDTGLPQQLRIFERTRERLGAAPPVVCASDVLGSPERLLGKLCALLGLEFRSEMLAWPAGPRTSDGVWAPHWYSRVWESTGFEAPVVKRPTVPARLEGLLNSCRTIYEKLYACRILL